MRARCPSDQSAGGVESKAGTARRGSAPVIAPASSRAAARTGRSVGTTHARRASGPLTGPAQSNPPGLATTRMAARPSSCLQRSPLHPSLPNCDQYMRATAPAIERRLRVVFRSLSDAQNLRECRTISAAGEGSLWRAVRTTLPWPRGRFARALTIVIFDSSVCRRHTQK